MSRNAPKKLSTTTTTQPSPELVKTVALCVVGGTLAAAVGALIYLWRYAALGREVRRTVLGALERSGSKINNGIVSGGAMRSSMPVNAAIHATIAALIDSTAMHNKGGVSSVVQPRTSPGGRTGAGTGTDNDDDAEMFSKLRQETIRDRSGAGAKAGETAKGGGGGGEEDDTRRKPRPATAAAAASLAGGMSGSTMSYTGAAPSLVDATDGDEDFGARELHGGGRGGGRAGGGGDAVSGDIDYNPNEFVPQHAKPPTQMGE